jgi:hypothetical protein
MSVKRLRLRLHLGRIEEELSDVQRHFPAINALLNSRRDEFTDTVRQNMLAAYEFLDAVVNDNLDLFSDEGLEALLQLNHLVLLGRGYDPRKFGRHISVTRRQLFDNFRQYVEPIRRWYRKHETDNPYKVASQVYVGVLSQPQLYQEGNHRTGSLMLAASFCRTVARPSSSPGKTLWHTSIPHRRSSSRTSARSGASYACPSINTISETSSNKT